MSTEPRRIKKLTRPLDEQDFIPVSRAQEKTFAFALSKLRVVEGCVTLTQLARERGIQAQLARLWLKDAGIKKPLGGRWVWKEDSQVLTRVRKALWLKP